MANETFYAVIGKEVLDASDGITEFEGSKILEPFAGAGKVQMEARIVKLEAESVAHGKRVIKHLLPSSGATNTVFVKEAAWLEK